MTKSRRYIVAAIAACLLCSFSSCGSEKPPRTREEIFRERSELSAVYLTFETKQRVIAPVGKGVFIDEKSGEVCWRAMVCNNPDCPGRKADGEPFLYIAPDYGYYRKDDGTLGYDPAKAAGRMYEREDCPECLKNRDLDSETDEQRQQYVDWIRPYELPETVARTKELDEELKRRNALNRRHRVPKPPECSPSQQPTPADPATKPKQ